MRLYEGVVRRDEYRTIETTQSFEQDVTPRATEMNDRLTVERSGVHPAVRPGVRLDRRRRPLSGGAPMPAENGALCAPLRPDAVVRPPEIRYRRVAMPRLLRPIESLLVAAWFGGALFLILAAQAAFHAAGNATSAANVVGAMLARWHYLALGAPFILLLIEWRGRALANSARVVLLALALLAASAQAGVDVRIHAIRAQSPTPIAQLARAHPMRRAFGRLHGVSMTLLALQLLLSGAVVAAHPSARRETT